MKKLLPMIVAVKRIDFYNCPIAESKFSKNNLDDAAKYCLQLGGFVVPPTLLRIGTELQPSYRILGGHFQCYAALRAYKIDSVKGETIPAIVIREDDPNKEILLHQLNYINYADS